MYSRVFIVRPTFNVFKALLSKSKWEAVQIHQHNKPTKKRKELLIRGELRSNNTDLSTLGKASEEFADLAPKGKEFPKLGTSTRKAGIKMLFKFVNPVIKIISSMYQCFV